MKKHIRLLKPLLFLSFTLCSATSRGQGNLLVTPRRIVFEGGKKTAEINLANVGKDSARYVVSMVEMRMNENGSFETITQPDSGENFASKYLRYFPRSVYLGPNEPQVIKVQLHNTAQLKPGEYRSHIYFRAVPEEKPLGEEDEAAKEGTISVKLTPVFGITIPVIIRIGESNTTVKFSGLKFQMKDTIPQLDFTIDRSGNMSVYGDVEVAHIAKDGKSTKVYAAKGLSVYTPNKKRLVAAKLETKEKVDFRSGYLHVTYSSQTDAKEKLAETEIKLD